MTLIEVRADDADARLDVVLAERLAISRSRAAARIAAGDVTVDGRAVPKQHRLRAGQRIEVRDPGPAAARPPAPAPPPVRFEDEHLLVVAKPAGMVVHPGHGHPGGTLVDALAAAGVPLAPAGGAERPGIVHRLDRETSGLLLVAKTDQAHAGLVAALKRREVSRRYLALVEGVPRAARGRVEAPLGRDLRDRTRFAVVEGGREAVTRYTLLDETVADAGGLARPVSLLACVLETGRTHQIRVHLTALGHPVVADTTYGASPALARAVGLPRVALHAAHLTFRHPVGHATIALDEPPPDDLRATLERLELTVPAPAPPGE